MGHHGTVIHPKRMALTRMVLAVVVGFTVSLLAEMVQTTLTIRVASWVDVFLNTSGALIGAGIGRFVYKAMLRWLFWLKSYLKRQPLPAMAMLLSLLLVLMNLAPFDFVTSPGSLYAALCKASWQVLPDLSLNLRGSAFAELLNLFVSFAGLGVICCFIALARCHAGWHRLRAFASAVKHGVVISVVMQVLQLFVASHVFEISDILVGIAGSIAGGIVAILVVLSRPEHCLIKQAPGGAGGLNGWIGTGFSIFALLPIAVFFHDTLSHSASGHSVSSALRLLIPFESLWRLPTALAVGQIASMFMQYALLGLTLGMLLKQRRLPIKHWGLTTVAATTLVAGMMQAVRALYASAGLDVTAPLIALVVTTMVIRLYPVLSPTPHNSIA